MTTSRIAATVAVAALAATAGSAHASVSGAGAYHVCAKSTYIEKAPASRPIGVVFKGMTFRVTDAAGKTVHPSSGPAQRWVRGYHATQRRGKAVRTAGWVKTTDLAKSC